ncbi:MAG: HlyD family efflux transporter periplasmic adaptor subunit [Chloroflexota bacterium]
MKTKSLVLIASMLLLLAACGRKPAEGQPVDTPTPVENTLPAPTAAPIAVTILADGVIQTARPVMPLAFETSGTLREVFVQVGDVVESGQLLAELNHTDQEVQYTQAKRELAELTSPYALASAEQVVAEALLEVDRAYGHLAYLLSPEVLRWEEEIIKVEQELAAARQEAKRSPSTEATEKVSALEAKLDLYREKLKGNLDYYENVYLPENFTVRDRNTGTSYVSAPSDASIAQARAEYDLAKAKVVEAENFLAALRGEEIPEDATGDNLTQLENAQLSLRSAENNLNGTRLTAPTGGIVTSVEAAPGAMVGSGAPIITIIDPSQLEFHTTNLSERDLAQIVPGQSAVVTLKAFPNDPIDGVVERIGWQAGEAVGDAATFPVVVALRENDLEIRPGMTGRIEIYAGE